MPRKKQFVQEEVVEKAMNLFWQKGYYATSMQDLVDTLGINRASIYDTFGSKKKLFLQCLANYGKAQSEKISSDLNSKLNVRDGLFFLFENFVNEATSNKNFKGCFIANTATELGDDEAVKQLLLEQKQEVEGIYWGYLKRGVEEHQISPYKDWKVIASYLFTLQMGLHVMSKMHQNKEELFSTITAALSIYN